MLRELACEVRFEGLPGPLASFAGLGAPSSSSVAPRPDPSKPKCVAVEAVLAVLSTVSAFVGPASAPNVSFRGEMGWEGGGPRGRGESAEGEVKKSELLPEVAWRSRGRGRT